jgi:hypothetical protein
VREIFSVRFFIAIGAVAGLLFLLFTFFVARDVVDQAISDNGADAAQYKPRAIDLVDVVASTNNPGFGFNEDGEAASNAEFMLDPTRKVTVVAGTPGEDDCGRIAEPGACAIVADLLGEGVVWFALVPMGNGRSVPLPAIDSLDNGVATLVNGWQLPHAPALDRRCNDNELFESYRQFKQILGDNFTTIYDIDQRQLTAVVCRTVVPYGPPPASTLAPLPPTLVPVTTPAPSLPATTATG